MCSCGFSDNTLAMIQWQAITWTNDDQINVYEYKSKVIHRSHVQQGIHPLWPMATSQNQVSIGYEHLKKIDWWLLIIEAFVMTHGNFTESSIHRLWAFEKIDWWLRIIEAWKNTHVLKYVRRY